MKSTASRGNKMAYVITVCDTGVDKLIGRVADELGFYRSCHCLYSDGGKVEMILTYTSGSEMSMRRMGWEDGELVLLPLSLEISDHLENYLRSRKVKFAKR